MSVEGVKEAAKVLKQYVQCDSCGRIWNVSRLRNVSRGYICPNCDDRMSGRRKKDEQK